MLPVESGTVLQRAIKSKTLRHLPALSITWRTWTLLLNTQNRLRSCLNLHREFLNFFILIQTENKYQNLFVKCHMSFNLNAWKVSRYLWVAPLKYFPLSWFFKRIALSLLLSQFYTDYNLISPLFFFLLIGFRIMNFMVEHIFWFAFNFF